MANAEPLGEHQGKDGIDELSVIPKWFTILTVVVLVWNILGMLAFFGQQTMPAEALAQLPEAQQTYYKAMPLWATAGFAVAVFAGVLGSILLMFKKSFAYELLLASFIGVLVQQFHAFVLANAVEVFGMSALAMPLMVFIVSLFLVWFAKHCIKQGWIT